MKILKTMLPIFALIISFGLAYGHGGEKHDSTDTKEQAVSDSVPDTLSLILDSIYAKIQNEFLVLEPIFEKGCFDCHTTRTNYPWYYMLPIIKGMIDHDVEEAKEHLDMSDGFPFGGHGKPADDLVAVREELEEGEMPPFNYRFMHWSANPSDSERDSVFAWVDRGLASLAEIGVHPTEENDSENETKSSVIYACPMHPEITGNKGDNCSICNMSLEIKEAADDSDDHSDHDD